ncbi:hypothetical protein C7960_0741 [Methanohalophilus euhalobius]|jgi:hypothetical protein|uniref:Uncharacterized protein n=1 Tax=Methanohalophilus euhalobius TaxID=51203 RepID=A0A285GC33_9EURY|nr:MULTISPECIES: hypothetical protein [Methanohalophilus]RSD34414.1 MAG: hypothetical protein CI953_884 [Methanohalophilus sp.]OBZ34816.1 MAG: hypothetical protein A9957_09370 [Methanohalophilus sp. DAL1]ODV48829.1 MAG: hypothetical protein A8273_1841 [Methanohalophilus sp. 2-GBenrich]RXG33533.1 hypothetical protein CI957_1845 [Methanohalophilus sp. WG1-DM]TCL11577.1 hypothetical protein C7960_0741 [Methanohalophilus euhalobius]
MSEVIDSVEIVHELKAIREDLDFIKSHMIDIDSIMTEDDNLSLNQYRSEKRAGTLISHEELKKELGL